MKTRIQLVCLWSGPVGIGFWLVGFWLIGGLIPPPRPSESAAQITHFYTHHTNGIRAGLVLTLIGATLTGPWVGVISAQLKRIEGTYSPLAYIQLGLGMLDIMAFVFPVMFMQVAAFRPNRDPSQILLLNDLAWIPFVGIWTLAAVQNLAIAGAVLSDRAQQVFPRWVGYFNVWTALLFCPGSLLYFFKSGPFAWNGALSWWFVVVVFCAWFAVMLVMTRRAILGQGLDDPEPAPRPVAAPLTATVA